MRASGSALEDRVEAGEQPGHEAHAAEGPGEPAEEGERVPAGHVARDRRICAQQRALRDVDAVEDSDFVKQACVRYAKISGLILLDPGHKAWVDCFSDDL